MWAYIGEFDVLLRLLTADLTSLPRYPHNPEVNTWVICCEDLNAKCEVFYWAQPVLVVL
jgi:hypothetical protein